MSVKTESNKPKKKKISLYISVSALIAAAIIIFAFFVFNSHSGENGGTGLISEIEGYKGALRHISREEFDFYRSIVEQDNYNETDGGVLDRMTREYANEVNAKFYVGNRLGLCGAYDFSTLNYLMEQENLSRRAKIENGETVYGPESFTLITYFRYIYSNLETDILNYILDNADENIIKNAREYYEAGKENFKTLASVSYELTENGSTVKETADTAGLRNISNADVSLYDFLVSGSQGQTLDYDFSGTRRHVKITEKIYITPEFNEAYRTALTYYINNEVKDRLYETVAKNNPVIFDFD